MNTKIINFFSFLCSVLCNLKFTAAGVASMPYAFNAPVQVCNLGQERHA